MIFSGDPSSTTTCSVDTLASLEAAERGPNPEDEVTDEEVEFDDVELLAGWPGGAGSQELFSTPEVSSQFQQSLSVRKKRERRRLETFLCHSAITCAGIKAAHRQATSMEQMYPRFPAYP
ncbi:hypothetical protein UY3_06938 [Chelonia mydas]|uniref:Uncharacterized protein n=1 Tax=Chelonia mydas TaxID=8469 RepID=M7BJM9_CHEMY|nr:hypothetical protein UY3_06938 [Chelonia mydas]